MAKQITQLPVAASVAASDVFPLDQSGTTKQATLTAIAAGLPAGTGTGGLVRETNPSFNGGVRITDAAYSYAQWTNTGAPTDKKRLRAYVETSGTTGLARVNDAESVGTSLIAWDANNNCGIGTTTPPSKLTVAGDIRLINAQTGVFFTDASGGAPGFICQSDNQFVFYGTGSAGSGRPVWQCAMRSDTSPLQVNVPLKIGSDGSPIAAVYTAVLSGYAPAAIPANGGVQFVDVTVTGATNSMVCMVECPGPAGLSNNSIILKANYIAADTVRIYWINPTAVSVTLSATSYRIACIKF